MKRLIMIVLIGLVVLAAGLYALDQYWIHRYDALIAREAAMHHIDPDLVWSIVYEETYFSPWKKGRNGEIGLMQVTPVVAREWAAESGVAPMEQRTSMDAETILRNPERNVQIGCWYLEKADQDYRNSPGREARLLAAYNAGPSRAAEWSRVASGAPPLSEQQFIARIDIASTRAYVTSILDRYHRVRAARSASPATVGLLTTRLRLRSIIAEVSFFSCDFVDGRCLKSSAMESVGKRYRTASGSERDQDAILHKRIPPFSNADSLSRSLSLAVLYPRQFDNRLFGQSFVDRSLLAGKRSTKSHEISQMRLWRLGSGC